MIKQFARSLSAQKKIDIKRLRPFFKSEKLEIVDVGATGGPESRWHNICSLCHFTTFDPDPRAKFNKSNQITNHPLGLWSSRCEKTLNLAKFPSASSLFKFAKDINVFLNETCHEIVGNKTIQLAALDELMDKVDFIKIDAEGAELEILKGAQRLLTTCLGLQLEVSFLERHQNAPLFSDLDSFLRGFGFQLFYLNREHWIRKNNQFCLSSSPQLIWGNAIYLIPAKTFIKRLEKSQHKEELIAKYLSILLTYRFFDYADDICSQVTGMLDEKTIIELRKCVRKSIPSNIRYSGQLFLALVFGFGGFVILYPFKNLRYKAASFLKQCLKKLSALISNLAKDGPNNCGVGDFEG